MKRKGNPEKETFRRTVEWKNFSKKLREERPYCECCGTKSKCLQVHHAVPDEYNNLIPENFFVLCSQCHKQVSRLERIKPVNWYKYNQEWVVFYSRFLRKNEGK